MPKHKRPECSPSPSPSPSLSPSIAAAAATAAAGGAFEFDQADALQVKLVERCAELARKRQRLYDEPFGPEAVREVMIAVTSTPSGKHLTDLRRAPRRWLEESLRSCDLFEADMAE